MFDLVKISEMKWYTFLFKYMACDLQDHLIIKSGCPQSNEINTPVNEIQRKEGCFR